MKVSSIMATLSIVIPLMQFLSHKESNDFVHTTIIFKIDYNSDEIMEIFPASPQNLPHIPPVQLN